MMNRRWVGEADMDPADYVALAGRVSEDIEGQIKDVMREKFDRNVKLDFHLNKDDPYSASNIVFYTYLQKQLPFDPWFEVKETPLCFNQKTPVQAFGVQQDPKIAEQVVVFDYRNDDDFIIQLQSSPKVIEAMDWGMLPEHPLITDDIVLAKISPQATLLDTLNAVLFRIREPVVERIKRLPPWEARAPKELFAPKLNLAYKDELWIPKLRLNVDHRYGELAGVSWLNENAYRGWINQARQIIDLTLDEKGAEVNSEAGGTADATLGVPQPRKFIFDKPFLLYFKMKEARYPYLALWVDNADFLVKFESNTLGGSQ
jgi:hypothetical protein